MTNHYFVTAEQEVVSDYRALGGDVERSWEDVCEGFDDLDKAVVRFRELLTKGAANVQLSAE